MNWLLALSSSVNWVDLVNYPHFGKPLPGQFSGPPVVFVLLDFALFLYLCHRFIGRALVDLAKEENRRFQDEVSEASAKEAEADRLEASVGEFEVTMEAQQQAIAAQIRQESQIEREQILEKARTYQDMRRNETLKQILIKKDLMIRQIRDELLIESLTNLKRDLSEGIDPSASPYLFQKGLDSTFEATTRHER
jgi:F0F1-type ATP synthase membrane subunit b/b'